MIAPISIDRDLPQTAAGALTLYAERIGEWWPPGFTAGGVEGLDGIVIEPRPGGRAYEQHLGGGSHEWGVVSAYDPAGRLAHSFHLAQDPKNPTVVEVRFTDTPQGSSMHFEHGGWTPDNEQAREKFASEGGWVVVLGAFMALAEREGAR